jgi:hypothetical protein
MPQSYWSKIVAVEPRVGSTKSGKPVREVMVDDGRKLSLLGQAELLAKLVPGTEAQHSKPFGDKPYATLELIEPPIRQSGNAETKPTPAAKPPENPILGGLPQAKNGNSAESKLAMPTWEEVSRVANAARTLAWMLEPDIPCDPKTNDQYISCGKARAAIINTIFIAFTNGKIQAPPEEKSKGDLDIPGLDAPIPEDDGFPWERVS